MWQQAWETGEARLRADAAWDKMVPDKRHELRVEHGLLHQELPSYPARKGSPRGLSIRDYPNGGIWHSDCPGRIEAALRDAALELEPKTQTVAIPRRVIRTDADLNAWLEEIRATVEPLLGDGPVWPSA